MIRLNVSFEPMRFRFKLFLLLGLAVFSFLPSITTVYGYEFDRTGTVTSVIDGDTFWVDGSYKVRLADVNTPEVGDSGADLATQHASELILGEIVYPDVDDIHETDWYGRYVCVVYVETAPYQYLNLNEDLLQYGFAEIMDYNNEFNPNTWNHVIDLTPEPTYDLTVYLGEYSGYVRDSVFVWGDANSAKPGTEVIVYWDSVSTWNGESGLLEYSTADIDGSYETSFTVPESGKGDHIIWVKSVYDGQTVGTNIFQVLATYSISGTMQYNNQPLSGVTVELRLDNGGYQVVDTYVTGDDGLYLFPDLPQDSYEVGFSIEDPVFSDSNGRYGDLIDSDIVWDFTVWKEYPVIYPTEYQEINEFFPVFKWEEAEYAEEYELRVWYYTEDGNAGFLLGRWTTTSTSYQIPILLPTGVDYSMSVKGYNAENKHVSRYSVMFYSTTQTPQYELIQLAKGWNLVSFPFDTGQIPISDLFSVLGFYQIYEYQAGGYVIPEYLEPGKGYWVLVIYDAVLTVCGVPWDSQTVSLNPGWTLIGTSNSPCEVNSVLSGYYQVCAWDGTQYQYSTTFEPGIGYWVLVLEPSQITMP